jgi:diguanylate cyclase (GGDEF)-like protein
VLDIRKFAFSISLPLTVIVMAWLLQSFSLQPPASIQPVIQFLPYVFILSGIVLAWIFHHSREFHILLLSASTFWVMQNTSLIENSNNFNIYLLYSLLCLLLPLNIGILSVLSERGIINFHGLKRLAILVLQAMCIYWLSQADISQLNSLFKYKLIDAEFIKHNTIPHLAQLSFAMTLVFLLIYTLKNPGLLLAARSAVLVCLWFPLNLFNESFSAVLWFSTIGILLVSAMILNSRQLAYLDELTNLPSRRALKQYLATLGRHYSIAMVDIDHFKKVNDKHGHDVGDQVLKMLATHLRKVHGGGRAFRYGGEEFTLVFAGKDLDEAAIYTDNLRETIANTPFIIRHKKRPKQRPDNPKKKSPLKELKITVSIGIAQRSDLLLSTDEVIRAADDNLYRAKNNGRNRVVK